ncbi:hypothetical protein N9Y42_10135 [Mariniblastus sp.]|nr:hypothetical protein [Mariniblastus sp.]
MSTETTFNREYLAHWYAKEHLKTDPGITKVIYVPNNAGPREIRLLEVNQLVKDDRSNHQLVPIDFGVDMGQDTEHKLFVVDITPDQWNVVPVLPNTDKGRVRR